MWVILIKTEYWVIVYELHVSDFIIFIILVENSSDHTGLIRKKTFALYCAQYNLSQSNARTCIRYNMKV